MTTVAILCCTQALALRDPTRPPNALLPEHFVEKQTGPFQLFAIFSYPDRRLALIDGDLVSIGDTINSYTITNIGPDTVELKKAEEQPTVLRILPVIKQASNTQQKGRE